MKGCFITIEGVEGAGKSTQAEHIRDFVVARNREAVVLREPGGTVISEAIRAILLDPANTVMAPATELLLYEASRAQLVAERIRPALDAGAVVICDRYVDSTIAYQGGGRGLPEPMLRELHEIATGGLWPDLTLLLDLPVDAGLARARQGKAPDRIEQESIDFHQRVRNTFLAMADAEPGRIKRIDAAMPMDHVAAAVRSAIEEALASP